MKKEKLVQYVGTYLPSPFDLEIGRIKLSTRAKKELLCARKYKVYFSIKEIQA